MSTAFGGPRRSTPRAAVLDAFPPPLSGTARGPKPSARAGAGAAALRARTARSLRREAPLRRSRSWRPATPRGPAGACARARAGGGLSSGARRQRAAEELAGRPSLRRGAGKSRKRVGHAGEHDANPRRSIDGKAASSRRGHRWPALGETGRRKTASHPGAEAGLGGLKKKLHELANRVGSGTGSGHVQPEPPGTLPRCARAGQMRGGRGWYQDEERGDERWVGAGRLGPRPGSAPGPAAGRAAAVPDSPAASGRKSPDEFLSNSWLCEKKGGPHGETRTIPS
ncbi:unnamed protein product [Prorocentrum cordatum]|uniref:Uncharacterized protein n=1 Tax=Prorocentrum cordatum TaxID=2364126 RepID=A0ABN9VJC9_9DINO|nr:unnamed protein product [Polarella glacialis]